MTEQKRPPHDWEGAVDKAIREAFERGEFENLAGSGKPLDLGDNPFTPRDWRLAYKILKDAGVSPDWIEQDKEIRAESRVLSAILDRNARWIRERSARAGTLTPEKMIAEYEHVAQVREQTCTQFRERATALNRQIDTFNLQVPSSRLHHARIRIDDEIAKFLDACR